MIKIGDKFISIEYIETVIRTEEDRVEIYFNSGEELDLYDEEAARFWKFLERTEQDLFDKNLTCEKCLGDGYISFYSGERDKNGAPIPTEREKCTTCKGTGKIFYEDL